MKLNPGAILIAVLIAVIMSTFFLLYQRHGVINLPGRTKLGELKSFSYSPGYSDMAGACHYEDLQKDENGNWVIVSRNRESFDEPTIVTTYAVSEDALKEFETYLKESNITSLSDRKDSEDFATDYSAWNYSIVFDNSASGGKRNEFYSIGEYKKYSDKDYARLNDLNERFKKLYGKVLSEEIEEDN